MKYQSKYLKSFRPYHLDAIATLIRTTTKVPLTKSYAILEVTPISGNIVDTEASGSLFSIAKPDKGKGIDFAYVPFIDECFNKTVVAEEFCGVIRHYVDTVESSSVIVEQKMDYVEKEQGKMDFLDNTYEEKKKEI
ncbi:hypothetical protein Tco_0256778 [Tanacetum coccineum]